jgi:hypothetical protein
VDFSRSKYKSSSSFYKAKAVRGALRVYLRTLLKWSPLEDPEPGYSVVIASNFNLRGILDANLQLIAKQAHDNMKALFIVFEVTEEDFPADFRDDILRRYAKLPIQFVFYDRFQSKGLRAIDWLWTYAWLSWCKAISICRTRYLILHDYDALPIRPDFFEDRYRRIREGGETYLGCTHYLFHGVTLEDQLATTWELVVDAKFIRQRFRPIDIFNHVTRHGDRLLDLDTFLNAQRTAGTIKVDPAEVPGELVHLAQVISQHTQVMNGRQKVVDTVVFVPYMYFVAGTPEPIERMIKVLDASVWPDLDYMGKPVQTTRLDSALADWVVRHIEATELAIAGSTRPRAAAYCKALRGFAARGEARAKIPEQALAA